MIILGLALAVIGWLIGLSILVTLGVILIVVGLALMLLGHAGRGIGGRNHYW